MAESGKVFNDSVHGHIELDPLCVKIIDTPQFQRMRHIKQLGGCCYVYPGATHNRFEHSIGVCFLAGQLIETLKFNQPKLYITDREVLCVKIAGLCHDLGHGPFSNLFDRFLQKAIPDYKGELDLALDDKDRTFLYERKELSKRMFDHLLDKCGITEAQLNKKEREFIKRLIQPSTNDNNSLLDATAGPNDRTFLFEIVANIRNGVDVDKWDYFARDCHHLGITNNFDHARLLNSARVICYDGRNRICFRDKEEQNIYNMFYIRDMLYRCAYKHDVCQAVEIMLRDALLKANDHLMICSTDNQHRKMSDCVEDMVVFSKLTDSVYHDILHTRITHLSEAAAILQRLELRKLYSCICQTKPVKCSVNVPIEDISNRVVELSRGLVVANDSKILDLIGQIVELSDGLVAADDSVISDLIGQIVELSHELVAEDNSVISDLIGQIVELSDGLVAADDSVISELSGQIINCVVELSRGLKVADDSVISELAGQIINRVVELSRGSMTRDDFEILVVKFDCGMDEKNPLESVLFYDKNNPETAKSRISKEPVSPMLPTTFCECILRFFWKKSDANPNIGRQAFKAWLKESEDWWNSEEFWKRSV